MDARVLTFRETADNPLLQVDGVGAPAKGRIWLAADGSGVVKTELVLERGRREAGRATITVVYEHSRDLGLRLPSTMTELYEDPNVSNVEFVVALAQYSDYRQFEVKTRIVK